MTLEGTVDTRPVDPALTFHPATLVSSKLAVRLLLPLQIRVPTRLLAFRKLSLANTMGTR